MTKQDAIKRLADVFKTAAFNRLMYDDGCPEGAQIEAGVKAVLSALKPGDELPGGLVVAPDWQPIETALKDGTPMLIWQPHKGRNFETIWDGAIDAPQKAVSKLYYDDERWAIGYWRPRGGWGNRNSAYVTPTYWMHLPAPPKGCGHD